MQRSVQPQQPFFDKLQNINVWESRHQAYDHFAGTIYQPSGNVDQILADGRCPGIVPLVGQDKSLKYHPLHS